MPRVRGPTCDNGTDPAPAGPTPTSTTWATGNGSLGYGDGETTIVDYGPDPDHKHPTTFRKTITIADAHQLVTATATLTYDDAAAVYLNGTEEVVHDAGNLHGSGRLSRCDDATVTVAVEPGLLVTDNTLAVEFHQPGATQQRRRLRPVADRRTWQPAAPAEAGDSLVAPGAVWCSSTTAPTPGPAGRPRLRRRNLGHRQRPVRLRRRRRNHHRRLRTRPDHKHPTTFRKTITIADAYQLTMWRRS